MHNLIHGTRLIVHGNENMYDMKTKTIHDDLVKKVYPLHRYSVDNFTYDGPSGILGSDGKQTAS